MKLVDDWRQWWRWHSTYAWAAVAMLPEVWLQSPELQSLLPPHVVASISPVIGVIGFLLRLRKQSINLPRTKDQQP